MTFQQLIKLNGKRAMKNKWSSGMAIVLILCGATLLFSLLRMFLLSIPGTEFFIDSSSGIEALLKGLIHLPISVYIIVIICEILCFIVYSPLSLGSKKWFFALGGGEETDVAVIFEYLSSFRLLIKSIALNLLTLLAKTFWNILFLLPPSAFLGFTAYYIKKGAEGNELFIARAGIATGIILLILALIMAYIYNLKYFAVPYAFINGEAKISEAFILSGKAIRGRRGELFKLNLSLIGYSALNLFILTRLYSHPYTSTVKGLYARYLLQCKEMDSKEKA